ncbi:hypothetical protein GUJ93_ZPchr0009g1927 [Zizania palustris]|uniref:Uncharacterized protein n=1 Tax=Zizania palustris TaxID=103762 RepID=A0A8J5RGH2_ZIZPA|nr:hypothetical protein GUJ93_ZPchr0009g1927 [Zizania palustris]
MLKKSSLKKALTLDGGSSSVQAQTTAAAAATAKTLAKRLRKFDLHPLSEKFEQTLELWATASMEESINRVCAGKISSKAEGA